MRKLFLFIFMLSTMAALAQATEENPKDLWTHSIDVTLGDNWRQKTISVPGKGTPNVVDFFRAFAKAYPCEYHDLLTLAIDGDKEVLFCNKKPHIKIDEDSCFLKNESFSMRVFYENDKPAVLGVCCHKALTTNLQDAYYYRYNNATRKLTPMAKGSDFTGGILKRETKFSPWKQHNEATMSHGWGRCVIESQLTWNNGQFILQDRTKDNFSYYTGGEITMSVLDAFLNVFEMELREPETERYSVIGDDTIPVCGGYNSLPICVAILNPHSKDNYTAAAAMEGFYYFYARGWKRNDGTTLVAVYTECAPQFDYDFGHKNDDGSTLKTPHKLEAGDEVFLQFYLCDNNGLAFYLDPKTDSFATHVGIGLPNLEHNEWRCKIGPDNEDLLFVNEADGKTMRFKWDGSLLKEQ